MNHALILGMLCKQAFFQTTLISVTREMAEAGYGVIICPDCGGSGKFRISKDDSQPCNECKSSGKLWVTVS